MQDDTTVDELLEELCYLILKSKTNLTFDERKRFRVVCNKLKTLGYTLSQ